MAQVQKVTAKATYNFATDTGGTGARTLAISEAIPNDAIIVACYSHCKTACTSSGSATIAITAGGVTLSPLTAFTNNAYDTATQVTDHTGLLNADLGAQATSSAAIGITVGVAALTAGLIDIYVDYIPA
tara:strand:- start:110 stop:496 length:387 start_codon:yes stop_codon:yes gene_type:complete